MKQIIVDFLRRWWGAYLLAVLFVGAMAAVMDLETSFTFVGIFMLPLAFELGRTSVGVMTTLPVSRRTIALSYWCLAVLLPTLLMAGNVALAGLLFHFFAVSWKGIVLVLLGTLALAGSAYCLFTFVARTSALRGGSDSLITCFGTLWFGSIIVSEIFKMTTQTPFVYFALVMGLVLTLWGYSRCEGLLFRPASRIPDCWPVPARISREPGLARFGGVFFAIARNGFLFGLGFPAILLLLDAQATQGLFFWPNLFIFSSVGSVVFLSGGVRLLRSLPLSAGSLASNLLLMPLLSILASVAGMATLQCLHAGHFLSRDSATFLIPLTGVICFVCSFLVCDSGLQKGYVVTMALGFPAGLVIFDTIAETKWPAGFWWLLGLLLMAAAFFLHRHWLRSSYSYRPSTGDFLQRRR